MNSLKYKLTKLSVILSFFFHEVSLSIIFSSKATNGFVQNLYRFLIDLPPLNNISEHSLPNLSLVSFTLGV